MQRLSIQTVCRIRIFPEKAHDILQAITHDQAFHCHNTESKTDSAAKRSSVLAGTSGSAVELALV
ncbi:hypothetical protein [Nodularia chucula]|uniref:hypothetical protein n=1 Tax=Nodularia chucula TaxID=3093667 RepID=UPI0039C74EB3